MRHLLLSLFIATGLAAAELPKEQRIVFLGDSITQGGAYVEFIEAALPALAGDQMKAARARGETQKSQITANLVRTFRGWLGIGEDPRFQFQRLGG